MGGAARSNSLCTPHPHPGQDEIGGRHPVPRERKRGRGEHGEASRRGKERAPLRPAAGVGAGEMRLPRARQRPQRFLSLETRKSSAPNPQNAEASRKPNILPAGPAQSASRVWNVWQRRCGGPHSPAGSRERGWGLRPLGPRSEGSRGPSQRARAPPPLTHRARRAPPRTSTRCRCENS